MEGTERVQPVYSCLIRIVYQSCKVILTWKGLSEPSLFTVLVVTGMFASLCRVISTWMGSERAQPVHSSLSLHDCLPFLESNFDMEGTEQSPACSFFFPYDD